jgi:hypothetical protein
VSAEHFKSLQPWGRDRHRKRLEPAVLQPDGRAEGFDRD